MDFQMEYSAEAGTKDADTGQVSHYQEQKSSAVSWNVLCRPVQARPLLFLTEVRTFLQLSCALHCPGTYSSLLCPAAGESAAASEVGLSSSAGSTKKMAVVRAKYRHLRTIRESIYGK